MGRKSVIKQVRIVEKAIIEINNLTQTFLIDIKG